MQWVRITYIIGDNVNKQPKKVIRKSICISIDLNRKLEAYKRRHPGRPINVSRICQEAIEKKIKRG